MKLPLMDYAIDSTLSLTTRITIDYIYSKFPDRLLHASAQASKMSEKEKILQLSAF